MVELKQKRLWDRRHFKLLDDGVWLKIKTPTENIETKFKYEELGLDTFTVRKKEASWFFSFLLVLTSVSGKLILKDVDLNNLTDVIILAIIAVAVITAVVLIMIETHKPIISVNGGEKTFSLLRKSPDRATTDKFIAILHERIRNRIIQVQVKPYDKQINLNYKKRVLLSLKENYIIDEKKYAEVLFQIESVHQLKSDLAFSFSDN